MIHDPKTSWGLDTVEQTNYKCNICYQIIGESMIEYEQDKKVPLCPQCKTVVTKMCAEDHICTCTFEISSGMMNCPTCGASVCPCGAHDVEVLSRVTGYLASVRGWNNGKKQELKDRIHTTINGLAAI
jgi:anaerobic ribonucleoside-triphosphate reductase